MIIISPMRIDLVGDGSDLLFYCKEFEGAVINVAINKYITVETDTSDLVKKSTIDFSFPFMKKVISLLDLPQNLKIKLDVPLGSGLGGSGSLLAALVKVSSPKLRNRSQIVERAWEIEQKLSGDVCGGQDQAAAVFGGLRLYKFRKGHLASWKELPISNELMNWIICFKIGKKRESIDFLTKNKECFKSGFGKVVYDHLARTAIEASKTKKIYEFSQYVMLTWRLKNLLIRKSIDEVDNYIEQGVAAGAVAAKLSGAGGGGFLVFLCPPQRQNRLKAAIPLPEVKIRIDSWGLRRLK